MHTNFGAESILVSRSPLHISVSDLHLPFRGILAQRYHVQHKSKTEWTRFRHIDAAGRNFPRTDAWAPRKCNVTQKRRSQDLINLASAAAAEARVVVVVRPHAARALFDWIDPAALLTSCSGHVAGSDVTVLRRRRRRSCTGQTQSRSQRSRP